MLIEAANDYPLHGQPSKSSVAGNFLTVACELGIEKGWCIKKHAD